MNEWESTYPHLWILDTISTQLWDSSWSTDRWRAPERREEYLRWRGKRNKESRKLLERKICLLSVLATRVYICDWFKVSSIVTWILINMLIACNIDENIVNGLPVVMQWRSIFLCCSVFKGPSIYVKYLWCGNTFHITVYPKKYAHGFCFAVPCCGYTLTDFPISIRLTSLALWQSNDCPSASKATLINMD